MDERFMLKKKNNVYFAFVQPRDKSISNQDFKPRDCRVKDRYS